MRRGSKGGTIVDVKVRAAYMYILYEIRKNVSAWWSCGEKVTIKVKESKRENFQPLRRRKARDCERDKMVEE